LLLLLLLLDILIFVERPRPAMLPIEYIAGVGTRKKSVSGPE
jgi:hypothetical protein